MLSRCRWFGLQFSTGYYSWCLRVVGVYFSWHICRRRQYIPESKDDYDGEWTDTEERCNIGVEGHGVYRRIQQFDAKAAH